MLENLVIGADGVPDFDDTSLTENTRAAYPLETLPAVAPGGRGGVPKNVVLLTADAFGVLPPLARLTTEQAVYHFLSGYTAKIAGTERGVTEPSATFSACFGAPFMPLHPKVYGRLLEERLVASGAKVWLLNTGWTGGAYGTGRRIDIATTRRLLNAALSGELDDGTDTAGSGLRARRPARGLRRRAGRARSAQRLGGSRGVRRGSTASCWRCSSGISRGSSRGWPQLSRPRRPQFTA